MVGVEAGGGGGGGGGGWGWDVTREGMHFSQSKIAFPVGYEYKKYFLKSTKVVSKFE